MKDFYHLFVTGIKLMYSAETQIVKAFPDLIKAAKEPKLKEALRHI
jgi:ferritin-like metal-binding protein YciE